MSSSTLNELPYCEWNQEVNLESLISDQQQMSDNDKNRVKHYYNVLQYTLYETNYPETKDLTITPRTKLPETGINIVILSSPVECMPVLLQGGQSCAGNVHLVLSTSWLSIERSDRNPALKTIFLHKAISMYNGGASFLNVFDPPRRVTYLMNNFSDDEPGIADFKLDLDCPTSSSINRKLDDKIWTRILMAKAGVSFPETLALYNDAPRKYDIPGNACIDTHDVDMKADLKNAVNTNLQGFLLKLDSPGDKILVRLLRKAAAGSREERVYIHDESDQENICNKTYILLSQSEPGDCVLIEKFYHPGSPAAEEINDLSFRVRAITCRGHCDRPITTGFICRVGRTNEPITSDNTTPQSLETTLLQWDVETSDINRIKNQLKNDSENLLREIIHQENNNENAETQSDCIAVDFVLAKRDGRYCPIGIGVKSCLKSLDSHPLCASNDGHLGASVIPLVERMCEQSQTYTMWGKVIVVLAKGGPNKAYTWSVAKEENLKIILVDRKSGDIPDVTRFIDYDFTDHTRDDQHAVNISKILANCGLKVDGCCTVWEDCVCLCSHICELLSLNGSGLKGSRTAKKKSSTQKTLLVSRSEYKHFPQPRIYAEKSVEVESERDIDEASMSYPCFIKREFGAAAIGAKRVQDIYECKTYFNLVRNKLTSEDCKQGIVGKGFGNSMMMMPFLEGTEHDVDLVLYKRQLIAAFPSDNGPTRSGACIETGACMPSCLPSDKVMQLITAAYQCCLAIGLTSGVFNVEFMMTPAGPKLIEINARMGGSYLRHWIKELYRVDILRCVFMCACAVKPHVYRPAPSGHFVGINCLQSVHAHIWNRMDEINDLWKSGEILFTPLQTRKVDDIADIDTEGPLCNIGVKADDFDEAKEKLLKICERFGISTKEYDVEKYIDFRQFH
ncbi:carnosine synthase 1-like [Tubulanus polymorphus]|uniref:carnosine synthase 1-like n=1 Tax=Tubulanus polymorphus TaxID=672921 RepID=UPI003DA54F05